MKNVIGNYKYSFRDPGGFVVEVDGKIFRIVYEMGKENLENFLDSLVVKKKIENGSVVKTRMCTEEESKRIICCINVAHGKKIVEHEKINFPSYPYEWSPEMLYEAGLLTVEIARELLDEDRGIKDASPYNVLFHGSKAVFVDALSIERRKAGDFIWLPYSQFIQNFLLPLLVNKYFSIPLNQIFMFHRDGLKIKEVYQLCKGLQKFMPPFLELVSIPTWLTKKNINSSISYEKKILTDTRKVNFILSSQFKKLQQSLEQLRPVKTKDSLWTNYMVSSKRKALSYSDSQFDGKCQFIKNILNEYSPQRVLDIGCNTGYFSTLAAKSGATVVSIDNDPDVIGRLWDEAKIECLDILPLVVDFTRPTPSVGWNNDEYPSFLERANKHFDMIFMLAVIHHMLITERVPLCEILNTVAELTTKFLVIEFITPNDLMFIRLSRGRESLYSHLTFSYFENLASEYFDIIQSVLLEGEGRKLYLLKKKD